MVYTVNEDDLDDDLSDADDKEIDEMFAECDEENAGEDKGGLYGEE